MVSFPDITLTDLETITGLDVVTGEPLFVLDELQNATIANTEETVDITGRANRLLNTLKRNKAVTISGSNGLLSGGLLAVQTGSTFTEGATEILYPDRLIITSDTATTNYVAVGDTGAEIGYLYIYNDDGVSVDPKYLTQGAAAAEGVFTYDPATKIIEFNAGDYADGTEIVAYYKRKISGNVIRNLSSSYSSKAALYIDAFGEDSCLNIYRVQFYIPKADFNGNFDITLGGDQSVHNFEARSLSGGCRLSGDDLWAMTVFASDAPDIV